MTWSVLAGVAAFILMVDLGPDRRRPCGSSSGPLLDIACLERVLPPWVIVLASGAICLGVWVATRPRRFPKPPTAVDRYVVPSGVAAAAAFLGVVVFAVAAPASAERLYLVIAIAAGALTTWSIRRAASRVKPGLRVGG